MSPEYGVHPAPFTAQGQPFGPAESGCRGLMTHATQDLRVTGKGCAYGKAVLSVSTPKILQTLTWAAPPELGVFG